MKKRINRFVICMLTILLPGMILGQVSFLEVTTFEEMEEARRQASDQGKMLFVDVYADWCGPCKVMDRDVYTDPDVSDYMNTRFVNVRLDGETEYGKRYAADQNLEGYPSMFIFSSDGERVSKLIGFTPAEQLIASLKRTVENWTHVSNYKAKLDAGRLKDEEYAIYINALREMGNQEQAEGLAADYMANNLSKDLTDSDISVVAFYTDLDDEWWPKLLEDQERIRNLLGEEYTLAIEKIYNNTLVKAVEEDDLRLISRLANELPQLLDADETSTWDLRSLPFIQYYYYTNQVNELISYVDDRFASDRKDDHRWLYGAASQITDMDQQYLTEELLLKGEEWFRTCIAMDEQFDYYFYHGMVLYFLNREEEAKTSFKMAETLASAEDEHSMVNQVLNFLE